MLRVVQARHRKILPQRYNTVLGFKNKKKWGKESRLNEHDDNDRKVGVRGFDIESGI